jgi:catechol 2,3-dioxygenase-like lactoylglutathione lyase family enzyme
MEMVMADLSYVLLYVDSPAASAAFYGDLLGLKPVELSPTFALFVIKPGLKLGLWSRHTVEPAAGSAQGGAAELALTVDDRAAVDATHAHWQKRGLKILQAPTEMDFGYTFTAADPDGHRLRVFMLLV